MLVVFFAKLDEIIERQYYTMFEVSSYLEGMDLVNFNDKSLHQELVVDG